MDRVKEYISHTTYNTNPAILNQIVKEEANNTITIRLEDLSETNPGEYMLPDNLKNGKLKELFLRGKRIMVFNYLSSLEIKHICNAYHSSFTVGDFSILDDKLYRAPKSLTETQPLVSMGSAPRPEYLLKDLNENDIVITKARETDSYSVKPGTFKRTLEALQNGKKVYAFELEDGEMEEEYNGLRQLNMPYYDYGVIKIDINDEEWYEINRNDHTFTDGSPV